MAIETDIDLTDAFEALRKSAQNFIALSSLLDAYAKRFINSAHNTHSIKMKSKTSDGLYQLRIEAIDSKSHETIHLSLNLRDNGVAEISTITAKGLDTIKSVDISRRTTMDAFTKIITELQNTPPIDRMRPALNAFNGITPQITTQSIAPPSKN